jgi:3-oxoacyl-[acyl-carrier-protein] synthase II
VGHTPIEPRRVVVTGIGVVTPIGNDKQSFWNSLASGTGGIGKITRMNAADYPAQIAGEVKGFTPETVLDRKELRHIDLFAQFAIVAAVQAVDDSGINFDQTDHDRVGVIVGSGIGGMYVFEEQVRVIDQKGPRRMSPFFIPMMISDIAAGHISIRYDLRGPNYATTSACATSGHAIGLAMKTIRYGEADIMVAGGAEAPICESGLGGFCALKALSTRNDDPEHACRPFDAQRDGFIMGEGAGILILESLDHALARGAHIYGEISGVGFSGDAHHVTAPPEDGHGAVLAMRVALNDAGLKPEDIDYLNAHGTSTQLNDAAETKAIKTVFGEHAYKMAVSSTKSMHGHLLGAAGAVELAASLLAIENNMTPPTINYEFPDPDCDLNYVPNRAVSSNINAALSNTFGFGGHNASLIVQRFI